MYLKNGTEKDKIYIYKNKIESNKNYSKKHKDLIEQALSNMKEKDNMEIELLV